MSNNWNDIIVEISSSVQVPVNLGDEPYRKCGITCWIKDNTITPQIIWVGSLEEAQNYTSDYWVEVFFNQSYKGLSPIGCYLVLMQPNDDKSEALVVPDLTNAPFSTLILVQNKDVQSQLDFLDDNNWVDYAFINIDSVNPLPSAFDSLKARNKTFVFLDKNTTADANNAEGIGNMVAGIFFTSSSGGFPYIGYAPIMGVDKPESTPNNFTTLDENNINFTFIQNGTRLFQFVDVSTGEQGTILYNQDYLVNSLQATLISFIDTYQPVYTDSGLLSIKNTITSWGRTQGATGIFEDFRIDKFPMVAGQTQEDITSGIVAGIEISYRIPGQIQRIKIAITVKV